MSQSLVTLNFTDAQLTAADAALTELETQFAGLIALDRAKRKALKKMGGKSETFCRQAVGAMAQNPQIVPSSVPLTDAVAGLTALDALRPRVMRLARLSERATDTTIALGSDVMAVALQGYTLLKVSGRSQGLEGLRDELGVRFTKTPRQPKSGPPPVVPSEKAA